MSSPISDMSDASPPPPPRHTAASDDDLSDSPAPKPASKPLDDMFTDDEDEAPEPRSRRQASPKDSDDDLKDDASDVGDDLFGDGSDQDMDDAEPSRKVRPLDDEVLDSGDDLDADPRRRLRDILDDDLDEEEREEKSYEVDIGLHKLPQASDDEVYILKIPQFISIAPQVFKPETFQAPKLPPDAAITPYTFATTAVRWRKSPSNPSKLESNSRIIEWSDGSFSLQIGSSKEGLYDLPKNPLVPGKDREYNPAHDSFTFLAEPLANSRLVRFFTHATQTMGVVPASDDLITDDIKQMVAARYKATQKRRPDDGMKQMELSYKIEDPEKARREAELLEKELERFRKKEEAQKNKEAENGVYKRRSRRDPGGGLNVDDLEEERYERKRSGGGGGRSKKDREDDYDEDDGFVEADPDSDEEEEIIDDSESEEEYESSRRREKKKKDKKKSRRREREEEDEDEEPEAEFTDGEGDNEPRERAKSPSKPKARSASEADEDDDDEGDHSKAPERKRRKVVIDDSEEE
ncbi:hypothetical protein H072_10316 [Dactylellina haptotyla CBS 200.50]|uniref:Leo1-like protein n=1 Tax=Dactylellina haptotyla (strain CBS 200.50) TaxID=1284197 RepID=S7ZZS8_DACHA|nr:hypothetical protein H072_10316 [Dactylellina haptotyla CBS 200.50]